MRAYRIWAALVGASGRPRLRLALHCALLAALVSSASQAATREPALKLPPAAVRLACFGVLGEVARPGVYRLPVSCTLGELVAQAGGVTNKANGNARAFHGVRLAQQFFIATSESQILCPGDLIVVECDSTAKSAPSPLARKEVQRLQESTRLGSDVQIGLLNLIDRPVVIKVPAEQASLSHAVETLGQPADLIDRIRVVEPKVDSHDPAEVDAETHCLRSGTVLIFPSHIVSAASLPSLPGPIAWRPLAASAASSSPDAPRAELTGMRVANAAAALISTPPDHEPRRPTIATLVHRRHPAIDSPYRNVSPEEAARMRRAEEEQAEGRSYFFFAILAGIASWAILMTVGAMVRRWLEASRAGTASRLSAGAAFPPAPLLTLGKGSRRPLRIDARQSQTRLALDLAIFQRAVARQAAAQSDDPPSRAA
jgi:SLBB domain